MSFEGFLFGFVVILAAAKLGGEIAERLNQPAVLGELIAGILVGPSVLGACGMIPFVGQSLVNVSITGKDAFLHVIAEIGAVLLLFEAGLESDIEELKRLGWASIWVACVGVLLPLGLGYGVGKMLGLSQMASLFLGSALTATSVGITARTFADLKLGRTPEAKIVLGAAVADDVLGLILLAVVSGMGAAGANAVGLTNEAPRSPIVIIAFALLFLVGALVAGIYGAPFVLRIAVQMRTRAALASVAVIFCFTLAALAHTVGGLAPIVGAFAAGLILSTTEHKLHFEQRLKPVADIFIPVFFVLMGVAMPIGALNPFAAQGRTTLLLAGALTVVAVIGKILAGMSMPMRGMSRITVGVGMIPRGEVGLIFASVGLQKGLITQDMFTAIVLMVMATTFMTPPLLRWTMRRSASRDTDLLKPIPFEPIVSRVEAAMPRREMSAPPMKAQREISMEKTMPRTEIAANSADIKSAA